MMDCIHALEELQARNMIHRDIKPENFVHFKSHITKLIDFDQLIIIPKGS